MFNIKEIINKKSDRDFLQQKILNNNSEIIQLKQGLKNKQIENIVLRIFQDLNNKRKDNNTILISNLDSEIDDSWYFIIISFKQINLEIIIKENIYLKLRELHVLYSAFDYEVYNKSSVDYVVKNEFDLEQIKIKNNDIVLITNQNNPSDNGLYKFSNTKKDKYIQLSKNTSLDINTKKKVILDNISTLDNRCRAKQYHKDKQGNEYLYFPVIKYPILYYNSYFSSQFRYIFLKKLISEFSIAIDDNKELIFYYKRIKFKLDIEINYDEQVYIIKSTIFSRKDYQPLEFTFKPKDKIKLIDLFEMLIGH